MKFDRLNGLLASL